MRAKVEHKKSAQYIYTSERRNFMICSLSRKHVCFILTDVWQETEKRRRRENETGTKVIHNFDCFICETCIGRSIKLKSNDITNVDARKERSTHQKKPNMCRTNTYHSKCTINVVWIYTAFYTNVFEIFISSPENVWYGFCQLTVFVIWRRNLRFKPKEEIVRFRNYLCVDGCGNGVRTI